MYVFMKCTENSVRKRSQTVIGVKRRFQRVLKPLHGGDLVRVHR